ncbi:MAG: hypothetical protein LBP23_00640 [Treponema sp.]|nr:hypothetical protein [Treponema sp.]
MADTERNHIHFIFKFDRGETRAPLVIYVEAGNRTWCFPCGRKSAVNKDIVETGIFDPGFAVKPGIKFIRVEPWMIY